MNTWPTLAILVITYNRRDVLRETLRRLAAHLAYEGPRVLVIADDGSDDGTAEMLAAEYPDAQHVISNRRGLGANANAGLRAALVASVLALWAGLAAAAGPLFLWELKDAGGALRGWLYGTIHHAVQIV